jgi:hypothetical protein
VDTGTGPPNPHYTKGTKINHKKIHQPTLLKTGLFILTVLILSKIPGNLFSTFPFPLAPEEGEEEATALGEEEAMRILEQQNDDDNNDTGDTAKSGTGDEVNSSKEMEPPQAPAISGDARYGGRDGDAGTVHGGESTPAAAPSRRQ